ARDGLGQIGHPPAAQINYLGESTFSFSYSGRSGVPRTGAAREDAIDGTSAEGAAHLAVHFVAFRTYSAFVRSKMITHRSPRLTRRNNSGPRLSRTSMRRPLASRMGRRSTDSVLD